MIDYEAYEPAILALLAPLQADGVQVRGMPDNPQQQGIPDNPQPPGIAATGVPVVVMGWFGSVPVDGGSLDGQAQAMTNRIVAELRCPTLRGSMGIYQVPGRVQSLLQGQRIAGLGMLNFAGWQLLERGDGPNDRGYRGLMSFTVLSLAQGNG